MSVRQPCDIGWCYHWYSNSFCMNTEVKKVWVSDNGFTLGHQKGNKHKILKLLAQSCNSEPYAFWWLPFFFLFHIIKKQEHFIKKDKHQKGDKHPKYQNILVRCIWETAKCQPLQQPHHSMFPCDLHLSLILTKTFLWQSPTLKKWYPLFGDVFITLAR